jgi:hypothetical protein
VSRLRGGGPVPELGTGTQEVVYICTGLCYSVSMTNDNDAAPQVIRYYWHPGGYWTTQSHLNGQPLPRKSTPTPRKPRLRRK